MNKEKKRLLTFVMFIFSTVILVAFDQWTKSLAVRYHTDPWRPVSSLSGKQRCSFWYLPGSENLSADSDSHNFDMRLLCFMENSFR